MSALLEVLQLAKRFPMRPEAPLIKRLRAGATHVPMLHAVDDVSLEIAEGESVGLVGESGCGKSTLARMIARLIDPTEGNILFAGRSIGVIPARLFARAPQRAQIQMVFQDPTDSLNPRFTALDAIAEPLRMLGARRDARALQRRVEELAELTGLAPELLTRFPHQLSGGQKARVGIARAIAVSPRLLILDEPTSALDVSVQALILKLLDGLRRKLNMSYLFVSHDLNVVRLLCDRVVVMYLGRIVESGPVREVFESPRHPYTRALISAIPRLAAGAAQRIRVDGEPQSPVDPAPNVCRFYGRCPRGEARCAVEMPALRAVSPGHEAACHFALGDEAAAEPQDAPVRLRAVV
jgi:oligopeptide/dipeptide ABC transporter ATP-binding protein